MTPAITTSIGEWQPAPIELDADQAVYAIGDIHGQLDLQTALEETIAGLHRDFVASDAPADGLLIRLGDLIDRGPDSSGVLTRCIAGLNEPHLAEMTLMGNHDQMLAKILVGSEPERAASVWLRNGGTETLTSMGIEPASVRNLENLVEIVQSKLGIVAANFLTTMPTHHRVGNLLFVHAGINPFRDLDEQLLADWREPFDSDGVLWVRRPFLDYLGPFEQGVIVVHGHTPTSGPGLIHGNRIALDTGAFRTRLLTGAELRNGRYRLISAQRSRVSQGVTSENLLGAAP